MHTVLVVIFVSLHVHAPVVPSYVCLHNINITDNMNMQV